VISRFSPNLAIVSDSRGVRNRAEAVIGHAREIAWVQALWPRRFEFGDRLLDLKRAGRQLVGGAPRHVAAVIGHDKSFDRLLTVGYRITYTVGTD
jgi:hypothetical protein